MLEVVNLALPFFGLIFLGLVLARQYNAWVEQASSAVLFGTLISVATLTTVMWLVKTQQLPVTTFR